MVGKFWGITCLLIALIVTPIARADVQTAQSGNSADQAAIIAVIDDQIKAFQADDGARAFSHASPSIQSMFGRPDVFMEMVRNGYQEVYRPQTVEFRDLLFERDSIVQRVFLVGPSGKAAVARYYMQRQPDGSWKINGVVMEQVAEQSV